MDRVKNVPPCLARLSAAEAAVDKRILKIFLKLSMGILNIWVSSRFYQYFAATVNNPAYWYG
jgi:hypothetical protein